MQEGNKKITPGALCYVRGMPPEAASYFKNGSIVTAVAYIGTEWLQLAPNIPSRLYPDLWLIEDATGVRYEIANGRRYDFALRAKWLVPIGNPGLEKMLGAQALVDKFREAFPEMTATTDSLRVLVIRK